MKLNKKKLIFHIDIVYKSEITLNFKIAGKKFKENNMCLSVRITIMYMYCVECSEKTFAISSKIWSWQGVIILNFMC